MRLLFALFLTLPFAGFSQKTNVDFPRDTTFTVWSSWQKIRKDFPDATPVKEFRDKKIREERNVIYYKLSQRELHADLFFPQKKSKKKIPAVILIHGGGWASGNKSQQVPIAQKLAENGYFAVAAEYRLSPEAKYPAGLIDLKTLVKWIKINAAVYGIDTSKIATLGCSSGATMACFLGVTPDHPKFPSHPLNEKASDKVQAIVNIDGIVDFTDAAESGKDNDPAKPSAGTRWLGFTYKQNPEIWREASPLFYADKNTPPTLFINSALPRFHAGRDAWTEILKKNNIYNDVYTIENTPHPFWLFHPWFDETWPLVVKFLDKVFEK